MQTVARINFLTKTPRHRAQPPRWAVGYALFQIQPNCPQSRLPEGKAEICFSTSSPILGVVGCLNACCSDGYKIIFHGCFNLNFPNLLIRLRFLYGVYIYIYIYCYTYFYHIAVHILAPLFLLTWRHTHTHIFWMLYIFWIYVYSE